MEALREAVGVKMEELGLGGKSGADVRCLLLYDVGRSREELKRVEERYARAG